MHCWTKKWGGNVLLIVGIAVPAVGIFVLLQLLLYSYCFRNRRQLPTPAPVATAESVKSPRRRETFVGGNLGKMDTFQVHERDGKKPCPLCNENLETRMVTAGRCGHISHTNCLKLWLARSDDQASCPDDEERQERSKDLQSTSSEGFTVLVDNETRGSRGVHSATMV